MAPDALEDSVLAGAAGISAFTVHSSRLLEGIKANLRNLLVLEKRWSIAKGCSCYPRLGP